MIFANFVTENGKLGLSLGLVVARLADAKQEDGRVLMRRLMWSLSEESGSLGWGAAEAMSAIIVRHAGLAAEFHRILCAYIHDSEREGLYLEHAPLRLGAYWGVGHVAATRPELVAAAAPDLLRALEEAGGAGGAIDAWRPLDATSAAIAGHAAWALGLIAAREAAPRLHALRASTSPLEIFRNRRLETTTVGALCVEALERMNEA